MIYLEELKNNNNRLGFEFFLHRKNFLIVCESNFKLSITKTGFAAIIYLKKVKPCH